MQLNCVDTHLSLHTLRTLIESSLIITGEWCHEVFAEYALNTDASAVPVSPDQVDRKTIEQVGFKGRGVQYYLGFHHGPDSCRYGNATLMTAHVVPKNSMILFFLICILTTI